MIKLPKQWKHWCRAARLAPRDSGRRGQYAWMYLRGRGREWRLNDRGMLQCGDTYADFDRWALCDIREAGAPKSRAEFLATVRDLLAAHKPKDNGIPDAAKALIKTLSLATEQQRVRIRWSGTKVPRGASVGGVPIAWSQNGMLSGPNGEQLGFYTRGVEFGGVSGQEHEMTLSVKAQVEFPGAMACEPA